LAIIKSKGGLCREMHRFYLLAEKCFCIFSTIAIGDGLQLAAVFDMIEFAGPANVSAKASTLSFPKNPT
jgi:hypothetical protein